MMTHAAAAGPGQESKEEVGVTRGSGTLRVLMFLLKVCESFFSQKSEFRLAVSECGSLMQDNGDQGPLELRRCLVIPALRSLKQGDRLQIKASLGIIVSSGQARAAERLCQNKRIGKLAGSTGEGTCHYSGRPELSPDPA